MAADDALPLYSAAGGDALDLSPLPNKCAAFVYDSPAFAPEQHVKASDAVAHTCFGDFFDPGANGSIIARSMRFEINI